MTGQDGGRVAIELAARRAFARHPYGSVTLRGIAADAGVSASLIVKHFGGKEALFDRVADFSAAAESLFDAPLTELGAHAVRTHVEYRRAHHSDPLLRVVFAVGRADEGSLLRERFRAQVVSRLAERLRGPHAQVRAELFVAGLLGLGAVSSIDKEGPAASAHIDDLVELYAPSLQAIVTPGTD